MGHKKNLLCACGHTLVIDSTQAGSMLRCRCGEQIQVPTLREISQLPDAEHAARQATAIPGRWTRTQGILFAIGAACLLLGGTTATVLFTNLPKSDLPGRAGTVAKLDQQLDRLSPRDTLKLWQFYEAAPNLMVGIEKRLKTIENQRARYSLIGWIVGVGGLVTGAALISLSLRGGKQQGP